MLNPFKVGRFACLTIFGSLFMPLLARADVIDDSHLKIDFKNFYLKRNFTKSGAPVSDVGNWSQGMDLQFTSGYTNTPIAFGLDVDAQYAVRLDSKGNDGSLPYSVRDNQTAHDYSRAGATFKAKVSKTELKVGDMRPELPVAWHDPSRQLDTIFQGAVVESKELNNLVLTGGRFWSAVTRESSNHEKFYKFGTNRNLNSDALDFAGATYDLSSAFQVSYFHAVMHDIYKQDYLGFKHQMDLGNGYGMRFDLRGFDNRDDGDAVAGKVDNRALSTGVTLSKGGHRVNAVYQRMYGDTIFPTPNGYIPQFYLLNWANQPFIRPQERSWSVGYAYDFAAMGVPGLNFSTRYIKGTQIARGDGLSDETENERDIAIGYAIQSGPLKGLGFMWRNYLVKQRYGSDFDENRLITSYTWNIW
ncbi:outer membrane porin, OprD family [Pseudomonas reinekei]|uniref:Porin n=1 Tax=Pseudomonas reinekei TaxID=395598 RepID=A0A1H0ISQ8_PSERE|nr:OprD family porin [Pseudomonas reinekei]OLU04354.1 porin [Pseudomonas reinekei]SDO34392.1 outer membrane porin, OprD family [Pseudomonas reinekei]